MQYAKAQQLYKKEKTHKVCSECSKKRLMKFFDTPRTRKCKDCQRKAKRVKKQSSKSYITKKLDKQWADRVKTRDKGCVYCGKRGGLNAHHIFSRSNHNTRHYLPNGITLCAAHHTFSSTFSAHKTPVEFIEWLKERKGKEWYQDLRTKAKGINKLN